MRRIPRFTDIVELALRAFRKKTKDLPLPDAAPDW